MQNDIVTSMHMKIAEIHRINKKLNKMNNEYNEARTSNRFNNLSTSVDHSLSNRTTIDMGLSATVSKNEMRIREPFKFPPHPNEEEDFMD